LYGDEPAFTQGFAKGLLAALGQPGCGDDNTFYSTLDRIDSGEVPIRVMAEIL